MIVRATNVTPMPTLLASGSTLKKIAPAEIMTTIPANISKSIPASRAARSVLTFMIEVNWRSTTIADSSSTELSEPKAAVRDYALAMWQSVRHCIQ
jgi:hypothetical protein